MMRVLLCVTALLVAGCSTDDHDGLAGWCGHERWVNRPDWAIDERAYAAESHMSSDQPCVTVSECEVPSFHYCVRGRCRAVCSAADQCAAAEVCTPELDGKVYWHPAPSCFSLGAGDVDRSVTYAGVCVAEEWTN